MKVQSPEDYIVDGFYIYNDVRLLLLASGSRDQAAITEE